MSVDVWNFSDLINKPKDTLAGLTAARTSAVRLNRRGGDADLMVTTADRYDREHALVTATARLLAEMLRDLDAFTDVQLRHVMEAGFAWSKYLDNEDMREFASELANTVRAAVELDNLGIVTPVLVAWKHSAEIYADPELVETLAQPADDHGPIPVPDAAA